MRQASKGGIYLALHALVLFYSLSALCSKTAASYPVGSFRWLLFYGAVILILGLYAIFWQQIIKRLPLSTAYMNKAATVIWGLVFGALVFRERVTAGKLFGAALIIAGIVLYALPGAARGQEA